LVQVLPEVTLNATMWYDATIMPKLAVLLFVGSDPTQASGEVQDVFQTSNRRACNSNQGNMSDVPDAVLMVGQPDARLALPAC
jgi:hypothetical protein